VVIPDIDPSTESPNTNHHTSLKRRQSESSDYEIDVKRTKLSPKPTPDRETPRSDHAHQESSAIPQKSSTADIVAGAREDPTDKPARRKSGRDEERKRGQRMFGALLGALSSSGAASAKTAKRRADIEKRQADKLKQLEVEVSQKHRQQAEDISKSRRKEQWDVDAAAVGVFSIV
jgi:hypothetical protein